MRFNLSQIAVSTLFVFAAQLSYAASASPSSIPSTPPKESCLQDGINQGVVTWMSFKDYQDMSTSRVKLCEITNGTNQGTVGYDTLLSTRSSIAATYLLKGFDTKALFANIHSVGNPSYDICKELGGVGASPCIFRDGSMASAWTMMYVSDNPTFLGIRKNIRSKPLPVKLPYLLP